MATSIAAFMQRMRELGAPPEAIEFAVEQMVAERTRAAEVEAVASVERGALAARRRADADRQRKRRNGDLSRDVTGHNVTSHDVTGFNVTSAESPAAPLDAPPLPPAPPTPPLNPPTTPDNLGAEATTEPAEPTTAPANGASKRGHRIPDDFASQPDAIAVCAEFGLTGDAADEALAEFVDYWAALPGKAATKLDWCRTLRNRLRETVRRRAALGGRAPPSRRGNGFGNLASEKRAARQTGDGDGNATQHHADRPVPAAEPRAARSFEGHARGGFGDGPGEILDLVPRRAYG